MDPENLIKAIKSNHICLLIEKFDPKIEFTYVMCDAFIYIIKYDDDDKVSLNKDVLEKEISTIRGNLVDKIKSFK